MKPLVWHTETRKISDLIPYEHNPRRLTEKQAKDLEKSLRKFNLAEIPAINTDGMICAGHQRLAIMKALGRGEEETDCRVPNRKLTEKEFKEYLIRSNHNTGETDYDILANVFDIGDLVEWGIEPEELGINVGGGDGEPAPKTPQTITCPECGHSWEK